MKIEKYFWDLNEEALKETKKVLQELNHPKFPYRMVTLLSRCHKPKELFSILSKKDFIEAWPKIRSVWIKRMRRSDSRDWWETLYEELVQSSHGKRIEPKGTPSVFFRKLGESIKERRIEMDLSQSQLAHRVGMKQPDISKIEEGKKNITLLTLIRLSKILQIKKIDLN